MIVVDAGVIVTALGDDGDDGHRARDRIVDESLLAPHLIDIEVVSAWRRLATAGKLSEQRSSQALDDLGDLRLTRASHQPLILRCWELRHNVGGYDAAYIALAEFAGAPLLTADARLAAAPGIRCRVEVIGPAANR